MARNGHSSGPLFHYLYTVEFAGQRSTFPDSIKFVIGRSTTSDFVISSLKVSGKHCEIICSDDGWQLHNTSTVVRGTFVNGRVVVHDETVPLEEEDILRVGNVYIQLRMDVDSVRGKHPSRALRLEVLIGEECCSLTSQPDINSCSHRTNEEDKIEDDSVIELSPDKGLREGESSECDTMLLETRGKHRILKELVQTKAALRQALIAKGEAELELAEAKRTYASTQQLSDQVNTIEELINQELQCSICNELLINAITLDCSHTFCEHCLLTWKKKNKICPLCRQQINFECKTRTLDNCIERIIAFFSEEAQTRRKELTTSRKAIKKPLTEHSRPKKRRRTRNVSAVRVYVNPEVGMDDTIYISDEDL